ncbi:MAG: DUF4157 domain-containing protein [Symploca sp. SIO2E6]|nr:DUF4157 domain-containing protein [Symploca sp. SIO2E6]
MSTPVAAYRHTPRFNSPQVQRFGQENNSFKSWYFPQPVTPAVQMSAEEQAQMSELIQRTFQGRGYQTSEQPVVEKGEEEQVQKSELVQRAFQPGGNQASEDLEGRLNASKGGGSPLSPQVRAFMEPRFGADFSSVRAHTDGEAVQMNRELSAQAFTHGSDVYFGAGKSPGNNDLTAHELTHVVQQGGSSINSSIQRECGVDESCIDEPNASYVPVEPNASDPKPNYTPAGANMSTPEGTETYDFQEPSLTQILHLMLKTGF